MNFSRRNFNYNQKCWLDSFFKLGDELDHDMGRIMKDYISIAIACLMSINALRFITASLKPNKHWSFVNGEGKEVSWIRKPSRFGYLDLSNIRTARFLSYVLSFSISLPPFICHK